MKTSEQIFSQIVEGELTQFELHSYSRFKIFKKWPLSKKGITKFFIK